MLLARGAAFRNDGPSARAKAQTRSNIKTLIAQLQVTQMALKDFGRLPGYSYERCGMLYEIYSRKQTLSAILRNKSVSTSILVALVL